MKRTEEPVQVYQEFDVSIDQLWAAITEQEQMIQWFFEEIAAFEAREGFETTFVVEHEGRVFPHQWNILEVIPQAKIVYGWRYEGYEGDSQVSFEVASKEVGSTLALTHRVIEDFDNSIPGFRREDCLEGWNWFIKERLVGYLAKT